MANLCATWHTRHSKASSILSMLAIIQLVCSAWSWAVVLIASLFCFTDSNAFHSNDIENLKYQRLSRLIFRGRFYSSIFLVFDLHCSFHTPFPPLFLSRSLHFLKRDALAHLMYPRTPRVHCIHLTRNLWRKLVLLPQSFSLGATSPWLPQGVDTHCLSSSFWFSHQFCLGLPQQLVHNTKPLQMSTDWFQCRI